MEHMNHKWNNLDCEIVLLLLRGPAHIRGIAASLQQPPSTVLRRINALVKQNVIDFNRQGRNKVFSIRKNISAKNHVHLSEHYKLAKILITYPQLGVLIEDILKTSKNRIILLFGSYAKSIAKPDSDIDIYIDTENKKTKEHIEAINSRINVKIGTFDPDNGLIKEIIKNHVILRGVEDYYEKAKLPA